MNIFKGKATYGIAVTILIAAISQGMGIEIPGVQLQDNWLAAIVTALGLASMRRAVG